MATPLKKARKPKSKDFGKTLNLMRRVLGDYRVSDELLDAMRENILQQVEDLMLKRKPRQQ
jgi:hypothetical protein